MKATLTDDNVLVIEGETHLERMALKAWEDDFRNGDAGFRIGDSEPIERAEEDVRRDGGKPQK